MRDFFDFKPCEKGFEGFGMFSAAHFASVLLCALAVYFLCRLYKIRGERRRKRLKFTLCAAMLSLEILRALLLGMNGKYNVGTLPLHLCSMAVYIIPLHALRPNELLCQFIYAFCMPGAAAAILFPDWSYYPLRHFMSICGFALHSLIVAYPLMLRASGELRPEARRLPECLGLMLSLALPVYAFDRLTNTNYMFLNWPSAGSPLEWFGFLGRPGYVLGYIPLAALVWLFIYRKKEADR